MKIWKYTLLVSQSKINTLKRRLKVTFNQSNSPIHRQKWNKNETKHKSVQHKRRWSSPTEDLYKSRVSFLTFSFSGHVLWTCESLILHQQSFRKKNAQVEIIKMCSAGWAVLNYSIEKLQRQPKHDPNTHYLTANVCNLEWKRDETKHGTVPNLTTIRQRTVLLQPALEKRG